MQDLCYIRYSKDNCGISLVWKMPLGLRISLVPGKGNKIKYPRTPEGIRGYMRGVIELPEFISCDNGDSAVFKIA